MFRSRSNAVSSEGFDRRWSPARWRAIGLAAGLGIALLVGPVLQARATSTGGLHVPTVTNYCGGSSAIVPLTICNLGGVTVTYDIRLEDSSIVYDCEDAILPSHVFLDSPTPTLAPGQCTTVRVRIDRPSLLNTLSSVCYWVVFESDPGGASWLGATLKDQPLLCFDWYFEEAAVFLHPQVPVEVAVDVHNYGFEPVQVPYLFEVWDGDGFIDDQVVSLNGLEPGMTIFGSMEIPEGGFQTLSVEVEWTHPGLTGFYDLVIVREDTFEPIASIGIGVPPEAPSSVDDSPPAVSPDEPFVRLGASPNPFSETCTVSFTLDQPVADASAVVRDASGRRLATLFEHRALGAGSLHVDWDGRDARGRTLPAGVFWIELQSELGTNGIRVVRAR